VPRQPTYRVERGEVERKIDFLARVQAVEDESLSFEVDGRIAKVNFKRGDDVKKGDVLAELDVSDLRNQIEAATIEWIASQAVLSRTLSNYTETLQSAELDLDVAQLRLAQARAKDFGPQLELAQAEIARAERNLADANTGLNSARSRPEDRDMIPGFEKILLDAQINLARAKADYQRLLEEQDSHKFSVSILAKDVERARLALSRVQSSVDPNLQRTVDVNRLNLERLQAQLGRAQIVAPFDGRITTQSLTVGESVRALDPVVVIAKPGGLEAAADLSSNRLSEIAVGAPVSVTLNNVPGKVFTGVVRRLPGLGVAANVRNADRSIRITIENAGDQMKEGDLARVAIITARKPNALWLPPQAIRNFQGRRFVVVRDDEGERRADVKVGLQGDDRIEILSGVLEGQTVVSP
jgi:RND family efflux transporter MFP subunit